MTLSLYRFCFFCYCVADNAVFFFCRSTLYFYFYCSYISVCVRAYAWCFLFCCYWFDTQSLLILRLPLRRVLALLHGGALLNKHSPPEAKKKVNGKKQQQQTTKKLSFFMCIIQPIVEGFLLANEYSHCGSCPCYRILSVPLRSTYLNCNYGFKTSPTCCGLPSVAGATQHRKADPCFFFLTLLVLTPIHAFRSL